MDWILALTVIVPVFTILIAIAGIITAGVIGITFVIIQEMIDNLRECL